MLRFLCIITLLFFGANSTAQQVINVKNMGAVGNGIVNDAKSIQKAIDAAEAGVLTTIYFPAGTYKIGSYVKTVNYLENYCLLLRSNLQIKGEGKSTIIKLADHLFDVADVNANAHLFYGSKVKNISFSSLNINMNGSNNLVPKNIIKNGAAIFMISSEQLLLEDLEIYNSAGTNMLNIMGIGHGLTIKNSSFINGGNYVGSSKLINTHQIDFSFIYSEWDNTHITDVNIIQENVDLGLDDYSGGVELHGSNSSLRNSTIKGCFPAVYISSTMKSMNNVSIVNNKMIDCVEGVSFWLQFPVSDVCINNNLIKLTAQRSKLSNISIGIKVPNGNETAYSKELANAAPIKKLSICGNVIEAEAMDNLSAGMSLHSINESFIANNSMKGMNYAGISLMGSKWGSKNITVEKNSFIDFTGSSNTDIVSAYAVVTDTYTPSQKNTPGLKNIIFKNNSFLNNGIVNNMAAANKKQKGKFLGVFIALPKTMMGQIKFKENKFLNKEETISRIETN